MVSIGTAQNLKTVFCTFLYVTGVTSVELNLQSWPEQRTCWMGQKGEKGM